MSKLVLYYSFTGNTQKLATEFAAKHKAQLIEVKPTIKITKPKAFLVGCPRSISGKPMAILPLDLPDYTDADIFCPVWAGGITPPMTAALQQLAKGTKVNLHLVSSSKSSSEEKNTQLVKALGLEVAAYEDIKA